MGARRAEVYENTPSNSTAETIVDDFVDLANNLDV